jgi:ketosteroid isomerase-like protein
MAEEDIESLRHIYDAMSGWRIEELRRHVTHDIEWNLPDSVPWGGIHHGQVGLESVAEIFQDHVEGIWADPDDFLDAGDRAVVLGRVPGRARSSGQDFEVSFAHVWGMTDGVPSSFRAYFDTAPITAALQARGPG